MIPAPLVDLAQRLGLAPDELLAQIADHPDLLRQIEHSLTLQAQLRQPRQALTLLPPDAAQATPATLRLTQLSVQVRTSERDERLVSLAKCHGYTWEDGWWVLTPGSHELPLVDRAVEMGCRLLHAGLGVQVDGETLAERIRRGDYTPVHPRWIRYVTRGEQEGWFAVCWDRRQQELYPAACAIAGSRYRRPNVVVPPTSVDELLDFAERYDFRLSAAAQNAAQQAQTALWRLDGLLPLPTSRAPAPATNRPTLDADETDLDDELRDDPL